MMLWCKILSITHKKKLKLHQRDIFHSKISKDKFGNSLEYWKWGKQSLSHFHTTLAELEIGTVIRSAWSSVKKWQTLIPFHLAVPPVGMGPTDAYLCKVTLNEASYTVYVKWFINTKYWWQPKCPSAEAGQISYGTVEYNAGIKKS